MYCCKCNNHLSECTCPDKDARLQSLRGSTHVAVAVCRICDKSVYSCKCADGPTQVLEHAGQKFEDPRRTDAIEWHYECPVDGCGFTSSPEGAVYRSFCDCFHTEPLVQKTGKFGDDTP